LYDVRGKSVAEYLKVIRPREASRKRVTRSRAS
jgi:hypothetical protein